MKKSIKKLEVKAVKNTKSIKGGDGGRFFEAIDIIEERTEDGGGL